MTNIASINKVWVNIYLIKPKCLSRCTRHQVSVVIMVVEPSEIVAKGVSHGFSKTERKKRYEKVILVVSNPLV